MRTFALLLSIVFGCLAILSSGSAAQTVVITAKPRFEQRGEFTELILSDKNHKFEIGWGMPPGMRFIPVSLDSNQVYTFTIFQKPFHGIAIPELRKVQLGGQTIYDIEVCEVHKTRMVHKKVKIRYGLILPGPGAPSGDSEQRLFPHRREYSLGGCVITQDSPETENVYVCSDCKEAFAKWTSENKKTK